jgi:hypothetical protein
MDPWNEMMEPNGFAILTSPRTLGFSCSRAESSFAYALVPPKHGRHTRVAYCRTAVLGCIEAPPSSSRLTAAFAPQLLLPTRLAVIVTFQLAVPRASHTRASSRPRYDHSCTTRDHRGVVRVDAITFSHLAQKPSITTPPARAVARHVALQHYLVVPVGSFCSGRSTPAHIANSHAPPHACLRHSLGTAHEPLLCRRRTHLLPHPRAWATPHVTAHSGLLASARVSHLLRSHASCTPLLARGRSHPAYP